MTSGAIGPGTLLAGRYRLEDLLTEDDGARFWRATDTVLARSVAIHALPSDDPRAPALMEAARLSATVNDTHLLRVLDADDADGVAWVVNEWGEGLSLDLMLERGTLAPSRAAWLTREVAEAIAHGHSQGVAHGRLNPESVLVTHAGAVKLIGYVVDASLHHPPSPDPSYGETDAREADVINLAGILYAALTGRWPGIAESSVPPAPREGRRPLRPRQVRAGVPRVLDTICDRVLHQEAAQHAMPIETAQEIAAALADFTGDSGAGAPLTLASMHHEPASDDEPTLVAADPRAEPGVDRETTPPADPAWDPEATQAATPFPAVGHAAAAGLDAPTTRVDATGSPTIGPAMEQTALHREPYEAPDSLSPLAAPDPLPPPPPFEDSPERPLFATTERRVPAGAASRTQAWSDDTQGHGPTASQGGPPTQGGDRSGDTRGPESPEHWLFTDDGDAGRGAPAGTEGRGWLRTAVVIAVVIALAVATAVAFSLGRQDGALLGGSPDPTDSPSSAAASQVLKPAGVSDFDPEGDPAEENPEEAPNAIDGDPATAWTTLTYRNRPDLGGLKDGVGLMLDLGRDREVGSVTVRFATSPTSYEVYAAPAGVTEMPTDVSQLDQVGEQADAPARTTVELDPKPTTRYVLVWLTQLPPTSGGYRGEIAEITARS